MPILMINKRLKLFMVKVISKTTIQGNRFELHTQASTKSHSYITITSCLATFGSGYLLSENSEECHYCEIDQFVIFDITHRTSDKTSLLGRGCDNVHSLSFIILDHNYGNVFQSYRPTII